MTTPSGRICNEPEEKEERERGEKNAIYSGHLRLCQQPRAAHALHLDQCLILNGARSGSLVTLTEQSSEYAFLSARNRANKLKYMSELQVLDELGWWLPSVYSS
jgi:hypothetical protein